MTAAVKQELSLCNPLARGTIHCGYFGRVKSCDSLCTQFSGQSNNIYEMLHKNQSPFCRSGKRKRQKLSDKILGDRKKKNYQQEDQWTKQFEDTRESGKKEIGSSPK